MEKIESYIKKQSKNFGILINIRDIRDQAEMLEELGYDIKQNLLPKDFATAHERLSVELQELHDKQALERKRKMEERFKELLKDNEEVDALSIKHKNLLIRLPYSLDEIREEGKILGHCVGGYCDRVAKGETSIFFIRKKEEPNKPYYTLEYRDGKVIQCRGKRNATMTEEVEAFQKCFERKMQQALVA